MMSNSCIVLDFWRRYVNKVKVLLSVYQYIHSETQKLKNGAIRDQWFTFAYYPPFIKKKIKEKLH